jgi:hypothetical protein
MQRRASAYNGYTIEAVDGNVGVVSDILFEDNNWKLRWFVIDTGSWLARRKILIHPSALERPDIKLRAFPVTVTKAKIEQSPDIRSDEPVSRQMDQQLSDYYGYSPTWGGGFFGGSGLEFGAGMMSDTAGWQNRGPAETGDPHLRSLTEVTGYHIRALDGDLGHLEDFVVDDETWKIEYALIDTKNWGFGHHVLVSPAEILAVDWGDRSLRINLTCYKIKSSASWEAPI